MCPSKTMGDILATINFSFLFTPTIQLDAQGRARPSLCSLYSWRYLTLGNLPHVTRWPEYTVANPGFCYDYQLINVEDFNGVGESEPTPHFYQVGTTCLPPLLADLIDYSVSPPPPEPGRGRVCCVSVHVHATTRLPSRQGCHPHHLQWTEAPHQRCAGQTLCKEPCLWVA